MDFIHALEVAICGIDWRQNEVERKAQPKAAAKAVKSESAGGNENHSSDA